MSTERYDVLVVGAGSAGTTAAVAAARTGARTLLVDRFGFLGGTSTAVLDTFYAFYTPGRHPEKVVAGIPDEVVSRLTERGMAFERPNTYGAGTGITYDPETLKRGRSCTRLPSPSRSRTHASPAWTSRRRAACAGSRPLS